MKMEILFKVLVVGGGLLTATSASAGEIVNPLNQINESQAEAQQGFCNNPVFSALACTVDDNGNPVVKDGFECCWGTSCGAN